MAEGVSSRFHIFRFNYNALSLDCRAVTRIITLKHAVIAGGLQAAYLRQSGRQPGQFLFAGRGEPSRGLTTRQYARLVGEWIASIGLDPLKFETHSLRRTKATLIYRRTGNLRAVQLLLGHTKIESTVRYLGIEIDDAIEIAEKIDV